MKTLDRNIPYFKLKNTSDNIYTIDTNLLSLDIPVSDLENPIVDFSILKHLKNDRKIHFINNGVKYEYLYKDGSNYRLRNTLFEGITTIVINDVDTTYKFIYGKI